MLPDKEDQKPRYRVSSSRDLRAVFDEAAKSTIGRGFTEEEMARAINAYQAGERGVQSVESGVVESMASRLFTGRISPARRHLPKPRRSPI